MSGIRVQNLACWSMRLLLSSSMVKSEGYLLAVYGCWPPECEHLC